MSNKIEKLILHFLEKTLFEQMFCGRNILFATFLKITFQKIKHTKINHDKNCKNNFQKKSKEKIEISLKRWEKF